MLGVALSPGLETIKQTLPTGRIRQGCPLAPLLFLTATELLALAINQDRRITGIAAGGGDTGVRKVASFVDDTSVFLGKATELSRLLQLLDKFAALSGLRVQPRKSIIIGLNTACTQERSHGIPVLQHGRTTRYLGVQVGTTDTTAANWSDRVRKLRTRLGMATAVTNSVVSRVTIINAIMLPAIMFTARHSTPTESTVKELERIQKQYLWNSRLTSDATRHKMNSALVHMPKAHGGLDCDRSRSH